MNAIELSSVLKDHFGVKICYSSLEKTISEVSTRFNKNDQAVICELADFVLNKVPKDDSFQRVCDFYYVDEEFPRAEEKIYISYEKKGQRLHMTVLLALQKVFGASTIVICCQNSIRLFPFWQQSPQLVLCGAVIQ